MQTPNATDIRSVVLMRPGSSSHLIVSYLYGSAFNASSRQVWIIGARKHLRTAAQRQREWEYEERVATRSFLTCVLAQFYLGRVYEREGKKTEVINVYQDFLNHFENSTARLPQIAEARAALKRLL